ncbi:MAG: YkgJ family cysteine cluster protein [Deltaproteobacteria bacterium]|nr:YkgJ family cysteine cluster protein [Deltaproteobacteria bacterium]
MSDLPELKLILLQAINAVFDEFVHSEFRTACAQGCAICCTQNVTATTLEALSIVRILNDTGRADLLDRLPEAAKMELFRPRLTTNTLAMACISHQEPPVEEPPAFLDRCLFLEDNLCQVYPVRPFTCRGMFASTICQSGMEAEIPFGLDTLMSICWQIVEHLDGGGLYGNLIDLLLLLNDPNQRFKYETGQQLVQRGLPPTRPVPGFLIPPEHQDLAQRFLNQLFNTDCEGRTFRERMSETRKSPF